MTSRIVLFGATGYTGELTARALVKRGQLPVLAGRNADKLKHLASQLGDLEIAVANVERPKSIAALLDRGDVLLSTVGPFARFGRAAVAAAVRRGAHYVDAAGEPQFIQDIFENWNSRARGAGCTLLTAMGYEFVPGNLAAALALREAGPTATRVEVGYFVSGPLDRSWLSAGTLESMAGALIGSGFARRGGVISGERAGLRERRFDVAGTQLSGLSIGGSEHFALPKTYPRLNDVDVYLGWSGASSKSLTVLSRTGSGVLTLPPMKKLGNALTRRLFRGGPSGPDEQTRAGYETVVVAETFDARGNELARVVVEGMNPYDFTAAMLAWTADRVANVGVRGVGALGPVDAFGLDQLTESARHCGIQRTE